MVQARRENATCMRSLEAGAMRGAVCPPLTASAPPPPLACLLRPNEYPSEVQFVPDPHGLAEDDGVLLSMVFDANSNSSYFQVGPRQGSEME